MKTFVVFVILLYVSQHAIGVEVCKGEESVLLPCHISVSDLRDSAAVWRRKDRINEVVHYRTPDGDERAAQSQSYRDRTSMRTDALQTGDLSLTLKKPSIWDRGTYTCAVLKLGIDQTRKEGQLLVRDCPPCRPPPSTPPSTPPPPSASSVSVIRLVLHLVVFCPYCICTGLMMSICCSRKTGDKPAFTMEMSPRDDITTEHEL